ncbi:type II toxin-antitoxin system RelE/ParE family toxin [Mucilaginibacter calamicampi]|uniref:Type II toxin-antitoxin system RelE/ParE family toxin n=1 Tax=Mucilaginibacter calamicampi TaxID=1302352 RepID=A0ABW2YXS7_9SPHI
MAFKIVWTKRAEKGYHNIVRYLQDNWSDREIKNFISDTESFFATLSSHPEILQKSNQKNLYRGPINKLTILTYRVQFRKKQIELINIRGARQKPLR